MAQHSTAQRSAHLSAPSPTGAPPAPCGAPPPGRRRPGRPRRRRQRRPSWQGGGHGAGRSRKASAAAGRRQQHQGVWQLFAGLGSWAACVASQLPECVYAAPPPPAGRTRGCAPRATSWTGGGSRSRAWPTPAPSAPRAAAAAGARCLRRAGGGGELSRRPRQPAGAASSSQPVQQPREASSTVAMQHCFMTGGQPRRRCRRRSCTTKAHPGRRAR